MNTLSKRLIATALSGALLLPTLAAAEAGPRNGWRDHGGHHHPHRKHKKHKRHKNNDNVGAAVAAGIIGLAAGAILLGATSQPSYAGPPAAPYYPPAPDYPPAPYPGRVHGNVGYQPWSPAWYQYCSSKYRSFNPSTGTYMTYRGVERFCQ
ncbi:BA14K family protein [Roseibium sp.]|uniref:BA14K family protein n=1 Tax=Roseibium sp. TaxID=1936156 RepID=UPI001B155446|nr:BA14K family protein [Roseibium sp.]